MSIKTLNVELGARSYPLHIGGGALFEMELFAPHIAKEHIAVVTDTTVAPLYLAKLEGTLAPYSPRSLALTPGEELKNWETLNLIFDFLLEHRYARDAVLIALGGGVVGDMTGFAAACYQRGIAFIQVPTTLLAQVDAAVGGKTAINHPLGKNMIGAFHQPRAVVIDTDTLTTLDERQFNAGLAETIKYGLIADIDFFVWLETHIRDVLARQSEALDYAVMRACEIKAAVVAADEREQGRRALLNLGHTFGHAIEVSLGYGEWLHGEAVAAGMAMAAEVAVRMEWLSGAEYRRIVRLLKRAALPVSPPEHISAGQMLDIMARDKKVRGGKLHLVLPHGIGESIVTSAFEPKALAATLRREPI
jgi:3-dehydroquinate synthase